MEEQKLVWKRGNNKVANMMCICGLNSEDKCQDHRELVSCVVASECEAQQGKILPIRKINMIHRVQK